MSPNMVQLPNELEHLLQKNQQTQQESLPVSSRNSLLDRLVKILLGNAHQ